MNKKEETPVVGYLGVFVIEKEKQRARNILKSRLLDLVDTKKQKPFPIYCSID